MFRSVSKSGFYGVILGASLVANPYILSAQRGPGGAVGGGTAAGTGMSSNGHPTGIDTKDDLRGFHDVLAVQATREQAAAYATMMKSTAVADAQLKALQEQVRKENNPPAIATLSKQLQDAVDGARSLNKKFIEGFSEQQKTGLKEIIKRLAKLESDLAQQAKVIDQATEANPPGAQMLASAQNLDHALANFQRTQLDLGEEMSIPAASNGTGFTFALVPEKNIINVGDLPITLTTSATVSKNPPEGGQNTFPVELIEDVSDLQLNIADLLRRQINKADRCGERIDVQTAQLAPQGQSASVTVQLHFERWTCAPVFGRDSMNEIVEGNGAIEVLLTPEVAEDGTLKLAGKINRIDAQGLIGDLLRSGSLGDTMRDKVAESMISVMRQGADFKAAIPAAARNYATLRHAQFAGTGSGKLILLLNGDIRVPDEQVVALTNELEQASRDQVPGPLLTRPATPQEAISR
ncbi:MAG: hypothetical protein ABR874_05250 [Candidatus Sulfotelmatobacter sp.]|jgi:hypothetical protein